MDCDPCPYISRLPLDHTNRCAHDTFYCEICSCILIFVTRRTYHNTRKSDHSNIQWLLHDPAYTSEDIDDTVLRRLLKGLRSVSPYISRLRRAHSNRCDYDPFYCEMTPTSTCYATSLYHALLPCNQLYSRCYLNYYVSRAIMYRVFIRYTQTQTRHGVFLHTHGSDSRDDFRRHAKSWRSSTRPQIDDHRTHRRQGILALP